MMWAFQNAKDVNKVVARKSGKYCFIFPRQLIAQWENKSVAVQRTLICYKKVWVGSLAIPK